jgi:anti-sigma factor RsiW
MNCPKVQLLLSDYLDGELTAERAAAVELHLDGCADCARLWKELRGTVRIIGHLGRQRCPVDLRGAVMQSVARTPARPAAAVMLRRLLVTAAGGGAVLASLVFPQLLPHAAARLSRTSDRPDLAADEALIAPVHVQYNMANGLGTADGLLLSLPAGPESLPRTPPNRVQR